MSAADLPAGRELDDLVTATIFQPGSLAVAYSRDMHHAWRIVAVLARPGGFALWLNEEGWVCGFCEDSPSRRAESRGLGETAPLAICRAALASGWTFRAAADARGGP